MSAKRKSLRSARPVSRAAGLREPKGRVTVVVEGEKTEPAYILQLKNSLTALVNIRTIAPNLDPVALAEEAVSLKSKAVRARSVEKNDAFWLVLDVDEYGPQIPAAIKLAEKHGIKVAVSNPCFEVWLLAHFEHSTSFVSDRRTLGRRLDKYLPGYSESKSLRVEVVDNVETALKNTAALRKFHAANPGTGGNPGTNFDCFVLDMRRIAEA